MKKNIDPEFKDVYRLNIFKYLLILLVIGGIGYGIYYVYDKKLYKPIIHYFDLNKSEDEEEEEENTISRIIYYYKDGEKVVANENKSNTLELLSSYTCKTNNCYSKYIEHNYGVIIDESSYIYNIDKEQEYELTTDLSRISKYKMIYSKDKLYGLLYKDEKVRYYSLDSNKVVYSSTTWDYYDESNYAEYGYIAFKTETSGGLLDLNTNKIADSSIYQGIYTYYDNMPVIKKEDKYYLLDKKLKPMNEDPKYIKYLNKKDYLYLMDGTKKYYKCDVAKGTCSKKTATYQFFDLLNDSFIILKGSNMYFGNNTYTPTKKIESIKDKTYSVKYSYYLAEKKGDKEPGYYLAFIKDDETKKYELYYFDTNYKFVSQESIDI